MEIDFSALASRVAAFGDVLGCILLSTDGLVLGVFPPGDGDGDRIKGAWLRFALVGEPERGFLRIDGQVWAYLRAGPYAAFAVASGTTRPGVLLDHLERSLAVAEESRRQLIVARPPGRADLVPGTAPRAMAEEPRTNGSSPDPVLLRTSPDPAATAPLEPVMALGPGPTDPDAEDAVPQQEERPPAEDTEVDRVVLSREFAGLLQEDNRDVDATGDGR